MAVTMHLPVIVLFLSLTFQYSHCVRREEHEDTVFETLRRSPWHSSRRGEHLHRESTTSSDGGLPQPGLENIESARRQLMDSPIGPSVQSGKLNLREHNGRIRTVMAKGSITPDDDDVRDWLDGEDGATNQGDDLSVRALEREIAQENARNLNPGPQDSVIDNPASDYDYPSEEDDSAEQTQVRRPPVRCAHCWMREEVKRLRIESIKTQILQKLRLKAPPNISKETFPHIPSRHPLHRALNKLRRQSDDPAQRFGAEVGAEDMMDRYEDFYVNTHKSLNFGEVPPSRIGDNPQICYFTFKDDVMKARIEKAKLWVFLRDGRTVGNAQTWLLVYLRIPPSTPGGTITNKLVAKKLIHPPPRGSTWHHFNIKEVVANWTSRPNTNYGLYIEASDHNAKMLPIVIPQNDAESGYKPFVDLKIRDISSSRHKRMSSRTCEEDDLERNCCRFPLRISFEDFGWDWVIAPKSYVANYCSGECPYVYAQDYQHTHLVQQAVPRNATICCTPRKMHALSMIYFADALNVVYGKVPEMVVDSCGCA